MDDFAVNLIISVGVVLVTAGVGLVHAWRDEKSGRIFWQTFCRDLYHLQNKGWSVTRIEFDHHPRAFTYLKAPDEIKPRKLDDAVIRQRKLDEIAKYNLPTEYGQQYIAEGWKSDDE